MLTSHSRERRVLCMGTILLTNRSRERASSMERKTRRHYCEPHDTYPWAGEVERCESVRSVVVWSPLVNVPYNQFNINACPKKILRNVSGVAKNTIFFRLMLWLTQGTRFCADERPWASPFRLCRPLRLWRNTFGANFEILLRECIDVRGILTSCTLVRCFCLFSETHITLDKSH